VLTRWSARQRSAGTETRDVGEFYRTSNLGEVDKRSSNWLNRLRVKVHAHCRSYFVFIVHAAVLECVLLFVFHLPAVETVVFPGVPLSIHP